MAQVNNFEQVLNAIKANNLKVNDDHNLERGLRPIHGLGELVTKGGTRHVVGLYKNHFCLNIVYLDDETGMPHISTRSVGGNVDGVTAGLQAGVDKYNDKQVGNVHSCGTLESVVLF